MIIKRYLRNAYLKMRCLLLGILFHLKKTQHLQPDQVESIVAIRTDRAGDLVVSLPAIRALKGLFPKAKLAVVARPQNLALLNNNPLIDELIAFQGFWNLLKDLRRKKFSLAVDLLMDYPLRNAWIVFFSNASFKAGFDIAGRGRLFNIAFTPSNQKKQMSGHLLDLIRQIANVSGMPAVSVIDSLPELFVSLEKKARALEFLKNNGFNEKEIIVGLHPGGNYPSQNWGKDKFAQLADRIQSKHQAKIIIIGSNQESKLLAQIASLMKGKPIIAQGLSLDALAALIQRLSLLVCNNSGPLHIAAALGVPTVSTMGPTDPHLWWPQGQENKVIRRELPCSPCNLSFCRRHDCMKLITVEEMEKAVDILMQRVKA
jgi:lipopolysaccharide heptosyltransferase II